MAILGPYSCTQAFFVAAVAEMQGVHLLVIVGRLCQWPSEICFVINAGKLCHLALGLQ